MFQIQANIRRTLRRPDDPTGTSTAGWQKFDSAQALLPLIPTKPARFIAGQRPLAGIDLELVELLGIGGFGEVWRAQNPYMPSASPVALKFCLDAAAAKSLLNEAALLDRIVHHGRHLGIVELRQTHLSASTPALQYEYIAGGDLADLIKYWYSQPTLPSVDAIRASLLELAQTMAFAHAAGIVHRDLKPANILIPVSAAIARLPNSSETSEVCAHPRFKIADFGIGGIQAEIDHRSRRAHTVGQRMAQSILGSHTPLYASPEQANGAQPHTADDVYALGVIWYQMLTGDLGQGAPTGNKWRGRFKDRGLTDADVDLLTECFEPRADRPQSARVLVAELQKLAPRPKEPVERTPTSVPLEPGGPSYDTLPVISVPGATHTERINHLKDRGDVIVSTPIRKDSIEVTGASANAVLIGRFKDANRGLVIKVTSAQSTGKGGDIRGPFEVLKPGDGTYAQGIRDILREQWTFPTVKDFLNRLKQRPDCQTATHILHANALRLADETESDIASEREERRDATT